MAGLTPEVHLIQSLVLFFLIANVVPDHRFIPANRRHKISACPKALADEIPPVLPVGPCKVYRALPLDEAYHLGDGVFGGIDIIMWT